MESLSRSSIQLIGLDQLTDQTFDIVYPIYDIVYPIYQNRLFIDSSSEWISVVDALASELIYLGPFVHFFTSLTKIQLLCFPVCFPRTRTVALLKRGLLLKERRSKLCPLRVDLLRSEAKI